MPKCFFPWACPITHVEEMKFHAKSVTPDHQNPQNAGVFNWSIATVATERVHPFPEASRTRIVQSAPVVELSYHLTMNSMATMATPLLLLTTECLIYPHHPQPPLLSDVFFCAMTTLQMKA